MKRWDETAAGTADGPRRHHPPRMTLRDAAADEIRRRVFSAQLRPGERIDQDGLARDLGVSRVPVREALIALHDEGIVENVAHRGAFVASLTREDVLDHYRLLGVVAGIAAERAAALIDEETLEVLSVLAGQMDDEARPLERERLNGEFHRRINKAAHSRRLNAVISILVKAIPATFYESHSDWSTRACVDHRRIIEALRSRDTTLARRETEQHFMAGAGEAVTYLERRGFWPA